ncbi:hypothetical protein GW835_02730 [archaeon]|nr:hypothetical protein [archaeon]NCP79456.1 hypothetical protein [archaeon]NCP97399.1 hypothetical protein [archaeon]NCQ07223.1 hypothetical protein [archaeon]NCQ51019.1 hypothetical protein [archaeon]
MFLRKEKGAANLFSYFLYIFVSIAILSSILYMVQDTIEKNQEKYNFDQMIENIDLISNTFQEISKSRFSAKEITIYNPEVLEIDCNQNEIRGEIIFNSEIRDDQLVTIKDIEVSKESNRAYFKKTINNNSQINIDCNLINLNQGQTNYVFSYQDYNLDENKIIIEIELLDFNKSEE